MGQVHLVGESLEESEKRPRAASLPQEIRVMEDSEFKLVPRY